jgi:hypothetical protein
MYMTWGNKLLLAFAGFAALIGTMVYKCMHQNFELVSKDYYDEELAYQHKIDGKINAAKFSPVTVVHTADSLGVFLPAEQVGHVASATVSLYCAANASLDRSFTFPSVAGSYIALDRETIVQANYTVKLSWTADGTQYYTEKPLYLK